MRTKAIQNWIDELKSGNWEQGKGYLAILTPEGKGEYCCLGVLAEINEEIPFIFNKLLNKKGFIYLSSSNRSDATIPDFYAEKLGLSKNLIDYLMSMNDGYAYKKSIRMNYLKRNFNFIARFLEIVFPGEYKEEK